MFLVGGPREFKETPAGLGDLWLRAWVHVEFSSRRRAANADVPETFKSTVIRAWRDIAATRVLHDDRTAQPLLHVSENGRKFPAWHSAATRPPYSPDPARINCLFVPKRSRPRSEDAISTGYPTTASNEGSHPPWESRWQKCVGHRELV